MQKNAGASFIAYCSVCISLALSCAGQAPPSGGPPDTVSPTVIATYPEPRATQFSERSVLLEFSEYVDRRSVEESIFISPDVGPLEFDWSGREVEINFESAQLRDNTTYVVTVGTDVRDLRNRNRMAESFSLAFSTGTELDSASLSGRVYDSSPDGITIFAYMLDPRLADTLHPPTTKPDYVTQTGSNGTFSLDFLAWGTYRLFAIRDQYKNIQYDPQVDQIGVASRDFTVEPQTPSVQGIQFQLTMEDTTSPFLLDARAQDKNSVKVRLSESLDQASIPDGIFSLVDTLSGVPVSVDRVYFAAASTHIVYLTTAPVDSARTYRLTVNGVRDTAGNRVNPAANSTVFTGSSIPDTLLPEILSFGFADSARNIPYDAVLEVVFSEGITKEPFERSFRFADSTGRELVGRFTWGSAAFVRFTPDTMLFPFAWYTARVRLDSVQDFARNRFRDSIIVRSFQTIDWRKLGSMRGTVREPAQNETGPVFVFAKDILDKKSVPIIKKIEAGGDFAFENVVEGRYVLHAFRDGDGNGKYSYGSVAPFVPSERFAVYPDTIKVRARWPVEGIVVRFGPY